MSVTKFSNNNFEIIGNIKGVVIPVPTDVNQRYKDEITLPFKVVNVVGTALTGFHNFKPVFTITPIVNIGEVIDCSSTGIVDNRIDAQNGYFHIVIGSVSEITESKTIDVGFTIKGAFSNIE